MFGPDSQDLTLLSPRPPHRRERRPQREGPV